MHSAEVPIVRSVRLQADRVKVRLKPDATYSRSARAELDDDAVVIAEPHDVGLIG